MTDYSEAPTKPPEQPAEAPASVPMLKCQSCDNIFPPDEGITIYQCGNCDTAFSQENSDDGCSNRCPDCHKFAAKLTEDGCPECEESEADAIKAHEDEGEWVEDEETETPKAEGEGDDDEPDLPRVRGFLTCPRCTTRHEGIVQVCRKCGWEIYNPLPDLKVKEGKA